VAILYLLGRHPLQHNLRNQLQRALVGLLFADVLKCWPFQSVFPEPQPRYFYRLDTTFQLTVNYGQSPRGTSEDIAYDAHRRHIINGPTNHILIVIFLKKCRVSTRSHTNFEPDQSAQRSCRERGYIGNRKLVTKVHGTLKTIRTVGWRFSPTAHIYVLIMMHTQSCRMVSLVHLWVPSGVDRIGFGVWRKNLRVIYILA
jgi:hypothetical protein